MLMLGESMDLFDNNVGLPNLNHNNGCGSCWPMFNNTTKIYKLVSVTVYNRDFSQTLNPIGT